MKKLTRTLLAAGLITAGVTAQEPPAKRPPLSDEQKAQLEQRANDAWNKLPAEAKIQALRFHTALTKMPPEERRFIHERIRRFVEMPPEERQRLRENAKRWESMSPEEREHAREQFRQRRQEFEEKWRREHPGEEPPRGLKSRAGENREPKPTSPQENP
ncbi:MAG: hypothetical protein PCFJNLEI_00784 [Verrucomicrobiae bacterium]|nr:hypothetical protein [Verrucomicrobiae bacterium]